MKKAEYAVQFKNLHGGPYDRLDDGRGWSTRYGKPFTREECLEELEFYVQRWERDIDPEPPARLVVRYVSDWEVEDTFVIPDRNATVAPCKFTNIHDPHQWWDDKEGTFYMDIMYGDLASNDLEEWHCPGVPHAQ